MDYGLEGSSRCPSSQRHNCFLWSPLPSQYRAKISSLYGKHGSLGKKKQVFLNTEHCNKDSWNFRKGFVRLSRFIEKFSFHLLSPPGREISHSADMKGFSIGNPGINKAARIHVLFFTAYHPKHTLGCVSLPCLPQISSTRCGSAYTFLM